MRLLLDSNALLWWTGLLHHDRLTEVAKAAIAEADQLFVSIATVWELEIKRGAGKLDFAPNAWTRVGALGITCFRSSSRTQSTRDACRSFIAIRSTG